MTFSGLVDQGRNLLDSRLFGIPAGEYAVSLGAIAIGFLVVTLFRLLVSRRLRKWFQSTPTTWDDLLVRQLEANGLPALYLLVVFLGLKDFPLNAAFQGWLRMLVVAGVTVLAVRVVLAVVDHSIRAYWRRHGAERNEQRERSLHGITTIAKLAVWIIGAIILLDNLGIKVSAFVAGLGITGIAVALAAQAILGDLFSYFVIFFDEPFEVGHVIKVDTFVGEVEHIGLKTTRLRSVDGEQIVVSNKFLTDSRVQNFKRMVRRRATFFFELHYDTGADSIRAVPALVKAAFSNFPDVTFDRAHFREFTRDGLRFEVAYFVETPDYNRYLDVQMEANLALLAGLRGAGMAFAFPPGIVHVAKESSKVPPKPDKT